MTGRGGGKAIAAAGLTFDLSHQSARSAAWILSDLALEPNLQATKCPASIARRSVLVEHADCLAASVSVISFRLESTSSSPINGSLAALSPILRTFGNHR